MELCCLRHLHELTAFPALWSMYPSPFAMTADDQARVRQLGIAIRTSQQMVPYVPPAIVINTHPNHSITNLQKSMKHFRAHVRLMMQLIPFHEAVDLSLWPSPFDASISKRKLEQWYFYARSAIRLLRESDNSSQLETTGPGDAGHLADPQSDANSGLSISHVHVNVTSPDPDLDFFGGSAVREQ